MIVPVLKIIRGPQVESKAGPIFGFRLCAAAQPPRSQRRLSPSRLQLWYSLGDIVPLSRQWSSETQGEAL
jgi:hypothetical protein